MKKKITSKWIQSKRTLEGMPPKKEINSTTLLLMQSIV